MSVYEYPVRDYATVIGDIEKELPAPPPAMPVRNLLFLSQTNITSDPLLAFRYALAGTTAAQEDEVKHDDPTAEGEGGAKAALNFMLGASMLRTTLDRSAIIEKTHALFSFSEESLKELLGTRVPKGRIVRELAATHILEGRAWSFAADNLAASQGEFDALADLGMRAFDAAFTQLDISKTLNPHRFSVDPYKTHAYRHAAELAKKSGEPLTSLQLAVRGIGAALFSSPEKANHPPSVGDHLKFVGRQTAANGRAIIKILLP